MIKKTAEIIKPFGNYMTPGRNQDVVDILRTALLEAEKGEITGIALVLISPNHYTLTRMCTGNHGWSVLIGGIAMAQDDCIRKWRAASD